MNEIEMTIYRHLSAPFSDLIDTYRERNPQATFDEAMKWAAAVLVQEQKHTDGLIAEMLDDSDEYIPISLLVERLEERNGI